MSLIPVKKEEIAVGQPLPWMIFDQQNNPLMAPGEVIASPEQLQSILDANPCRELTWESGANSGGASAPVEEFTPDKAQGEQQITYTFADMKLRVGDRLQIQPPAQLSPERFIVRLIGYVSNGSVLVTAPTMASGLRLQLMEGEKVVVRSFSSQNAFGFTSSIDKVCKFPYDYLHLSFPEVVQGMIIRKAPRVRTKIITTIAKENPVEGVDPLSGVIANISASGALLDARRALGEKGESLKLSFRVNLHNIDAYLTTMAVIRAVFSDDDVVDSGTPNSMIHHGIEFRSLQPNDSVILQSLIYQQMIESPHTLT